MKRRQGLWASAALASLFLLCSAASPQTSSLPLPTAPMNGQPAPTMPLDTAPVTEWGEKTLCPWKVDFLLGFPVEVRVERVLPVGGEHPLILEAYVADYLGTPMAGGGVRWNCATFHDGCNAFTVAPGIDVGVWQNPYYHTGGWLDDDVRGGPLVSLDFDFLWRHQYSDRLIGELGCKLGVASVFASADWGLLPIVGICAGLEF